MIPLFDTRVLAVQVNRPQRNHPIRRFGAPVAVDPFPPTLHEALRLYFIITIPIPYSGGAGKRSFVYKGMQGLLNIPLGQGASLVGWALVRRLQAATAPGLGDQAFLHWSENTKEGETARRMYHNIVRDPMGKNEIEIIRLNKKTAELQKRIAEILPPQYYGETALTALEKLHQALLKGKTKK